MITSGNSKNMNEISQKQKNRNVGRKTVMTPEIVTKLEQVFAMGGTDEEACLYAGIGKSTLYNYQQKVPEFLERKEALKMNPIFKARETIVAALDDPNIAKWYLERKRKQEFSPRQEITGDGKEPMVIQIIDFKGHEK
jgi:hypothetical protein